MNRNQLVKAIESDPRWRVVVEERFWICPCCGEGAARYQPSARKLAVEVFNHLQGECPTWDKGSGTLLSPEKLQDSAEAFYLRHKVSTDPLWKVVDGRGVWYCPFCALPTRGRFDPSGRFTPRTIQQMAGHLDQCERRTQGRAASPLQLQASFHLCTDLSWKYFTRERSWICPFCVKRTEVKIAEDMQITSEVVDSMASHLDDCYAYRERGNVPQPTEELQAAVLLENRLLRWKPRIHDLLENDQVWSHTIDNAVWVCPFCRNPIDHIRLSSQLVRQETCPLQITAHLMKQCAPFQEKNPPATSVNELELAVAKKSARTHSQEVSTTGTSEEIPDEYQSSAVLTAISREILDLKSMVQTQDNLQKSLEGARKKQLQMLPQTPTIEGYEFVAVYRPCDSVSGDFYDFFEVKEGTIGIVIGDVSGHGMDAALVMGMAKKLINIYARRRSNPSEVLSIANEDIRNDLDQETFVTAFYSILDTQNKTLTYARAGHTPLVLFHPDRNPPIQILQPPGIALGVRSSAQFDSSVESATLALRSGDLLLQFTDGLTEAMNPQGEEFGIDRVLAVIEQAGTHEAEYLAYQLDRALRQFGAPEVQEDDMTVLICRLL